MRFVRWMLSAVAALTGVVWVAEAQASALSDAAAQLQPGSWVELPTTGFNSQLLLQGGGHDVFQYTESLRWDPDQREVHFVGAGHLQPTKHIVYSESSNAWGTRPVPGYFEPSHAFDHLTIDPAGRTLYVRLFNSAIIERYNLDTRTWTRSVSLNTGMQVAAGVEWFPELGRIVFADGDYGVSLYDPAGNRWETKTGTLAGLGPYNNFAEYSPTHRMVVFGGGNGSNAVYRINNAGTVTRLSNAPFTVGVTHSIFTVDPVSGNFLVFGDNSFYEFNPQTDTWTLQTRPSFLSAGQYGGIGDAVATPLSTHGVVMVAKWNFDNSKVWLYKHRAGGSPQPQVTINANPTSVPAQGTTTLNWSTTNADSCTASGGWTGTKATSGSESRGPLAATTTFTLTCTNTAGSASGAVTVTVTASNPPPTVTFSANPAAVALNGFSTLQWTSSNATDCQGSGGLSGWAGSKATQGSQNVGPFAAAATFDLSCTGAGGTTQRSATVSLLSAPAVTFSANPTTVTAGGRSTLTWSSTGATGCAASGSWAGNKATSGSEQTAVLNATSNFVLDCTGAGGSTQRSVTVTVSGAPPPPPTVSLSANPTAVNVNGSSTLTWSSTNATACTASGGWTGSKATSGNESTGALSNTQSYTLTCTGAGGSANASATVTVNAGGGGGGGSSTDSGGGALGWLSLAALAMLLARRRFGVAV